MFPGMYASRIFESTGIDSDDIPRVPVYWRSAWRKSTAHCGQRLPLPPRSMSYQSWLWSQTSLLWLSSIQSFLQRSSDCPSLLLLQTTLLHASPLHHWYSSDFKTDAVVGVSGNHKYRHQLLSDHVTIACEKWVPYFMDYKTNFFLQKIASKMQVCLILEINIKMSSVWFKIPASLINGHIFDAAGNLSLSGNIGFIWRQQCTDAMNMSMYMSKGIH